MPVRIPDTLLMEFTPIIVEYVEILPFSGKSTWRARSKLQPSVTEYGETALDALMNLQMEIWEQKKKEEAHATRENRSISDDPSTVVQSWEKRRRAGLEKQLDQIRTKYPQAHYEPPIVGKQGDYNERLIVVPGFNLIKGWNATICTVLMLLTLHEETCGPLYGFFVDLPLKLANNAEPEYSRNDTKVAWQTKEDWKECHFIPGHPQWKNITRFWWRARHSNPNHDTIYTALMLVRRRLRMLR